MTPRAPLANSTMATATSSTSIRSWASMAVRAQTVLIGPTSHTSRSMAWMPWFIRHPPPSSFHVPRQSPLS